MHTRFLILSKFLCFKNEISHFLNIGRTEISADFCKTLSKHNQSALIRQTTVAYPEGVRGGGVQTNTLLSLNYFIFMGISGKIGKLHKSNPPQLIWTPNPKILDPPMNHLKFYIPSLDQY